MKININDNIPKYILEVLNILTINGYEGYIVGGCIRDILLNKKPNDYDITTNAKPEEVKSIFTDYKTIDIGSKYGTIMLIYKDNIIEITTYRIESEYIDNRRPDKVIFTSNLKDDLKRRDFTINAMAYNNKSGLIDYFDGVNDLYNRTIKTVGDPNERFTEDALRLIRAVRFSSQLGFTIDDKTLDSIKSNSYLIENISKERIKDELFKILISKKPSEGIITLNKVDLLRYILPELIKTIDFNQNNPYHDKDVFHHTMCVLDNVENKIELRLAALFHDIAKPETYSEDENGIGHFYNHELVSCEIAKNILNRLNTPKSIVEKVLLLIKNHMYDISEMKEKGIRRLIYKVGEENILDLYNLNLADKSCSYKGRDLEKLIDKKNMIIKELESENIFNKNKLKIDGYDIMGLGIKQGKLVGDILDELMGLVIDDKKLNNKEYLLSFVKEKYLNQEDKA